MTEIAVGDAGWRRGNPDDMKLTAIKGRNVLDLELMAPGARGKGDALVALGRAAIAKLLIAGRLGVALPLFGAVVAYLIRPDWMAWGHADP